MNVKSLKDAVVREDRPKDRVVPPVKAEDPEIQMAVDAFPGKKAALDALVGEVEGLAGKIGAFGAKSIIDIATEVGNPVSTVRVEGANGPVDVTVRNGWSKISDRDFGAVREALPDADILFEKEEQVVLIDPRPSTLRKICEALGIQDEEKFRKFFDVVRTHRATAEFHDRFTTEPALREKAAPLMDDRGGKVKPILRNAAPSVKPTKGAK
jgi:hypothetical protein